MSIDPIVRQIVSRCHVGSSYRRVIREVAMSVNGGIRRFLRAPRSQRKLAMRMAVHVHKENQELYHTVMTGQF